MDDRERAEAEIDRRSGVMHEAARLARWWKPGEKWQRPHAPATSAGHEDPQR